MHAKVNKQPIFMESHDVISDPKYFLFCFKICSITSISTSRLLLVHPLSFIFIHFLSFASPITGIENYFFYGLLITSFSLPSLSLPTTFLSLLTPDAIGTAILLTLLIMNEDD